MRRVLFHYKYLHVLLHRIALEERSSERWMALKGDQLQAHNAVPAQAALFI